MSSEYIFSKKVEIPSQFTVFSDSLETYFSQFDVFVSAISDKSISTSVTAHEDSIEIEVQSIDFSSEGVEQLYHSYISFIADSVLEQGVFTDFETGENIFLSGLVLYTQSMYEELQTLVQLNKELKQLFLESLDYQASLQADKKFLQSLLQKKEQKHSMNVHINNSTIQNSGLLNLGQVYGNAVASISSIAHPDDVNEDEYLQIQEQLQALLERIKTNQELVEQDKEDAANEIKAIADNARDKKNPETESFIQRSIRNISRILSVAEVSAEAIDTLQQLAQSFGMKI